MSYRRVLFFNGPGFSVITVPTLWALIGPPPVPVLAPLVPPPTTTSCRVGLPSRPPYPGSGIMCNSQRLDLRTLVSTKSLKSKKVENLINVI